MAPGRNPRGSVSAGGRGGGGRGGGGRGRGRGARGGRGARSSGRGTALPSSFTGRGAGGGGAKGDGRRRRGGGDRSGAGYEFDDGGGRSDRHKYDDEAGDSDNGPGPEDSDFEDEEVDEDAAFDSADEARYGEIMDTILERRSGKRGAGSEEDDESEDESDDDGEGGGMSVMDMLAANEAAEAAKTDHAAGKAKGRLQGAGRPSGGGGGGSNNCTAPASAASSADASGDEAGLDGDDAMDEDVSGDGDDSEEDGSDSDEDGEGEEERHARLLGFVGTLGEQAAAARQAADDRCSSQLLREGEFNPTAVAAVSSGGGSASKSAITMETLMGSLQNSKGFAAVKKQVAAFSGKSGAPSAPVSKTAELRAERETAYDSRKSDMGKWVAPVQANRQAETLDFAPAVRTNLSNAAMASKMQPTTDMEKEVEMLLTAGGATEAGLAEQEMEELKPKAYTVEEVKERQAELSKMRALMFYHERKQHHMNKIKSKVYRKIKKRQRDRAGDAQPEADGELGEAAARKRAEERMSLRHKNTTKWVKNALRAKGGAGKDDRKAIAEQLKIGQELRAKMDGIGNESSDDDSSSEDEEEEGVYKPKAKKRKSALSVADREELEGIGGDDEDQDGVAAGGKGAALLKMAFMQKAMDKQRERARVEASVVLRELEEASAAAAAAEDGGSDDDSRSNTASGAAASSSWGAGGAGDAAGDRGGVSTRASAATRAKAAAEVANALPAGALQSSAVSMDARVRSSVASPITIDLGGGGEGAGGAAGSSGKSTSSAGLKMGAGGGKAVSLNRPSDGAGANGAHGTRGGREAMSDGEEEEEEADKSNPWLAPTPRRSKERRRASNGEVLLDVRKAAATALSAFGGTPDAENANGGGKGAGKAAGGGQAGSGKAGGAARGDGSSLPGNGQAEQGKGKGKGKGRQKKKRKRSGSDGGGGDGLECAVGGSGGEGAAEDMVDAEHVGGNKKKKRKKNKKSKAKKTVAEGGKEGETSLSGGAGKGEGDPAPAAKKKGEKGGAGGEESSAEMTAGAKGAGDTKKKHKRKTKKENAATGGEAGGAGASEGSGQTKQTDGAGAKEAGGRKKRKKKPAKAGQAAAAAAAAAGRASPKLAGLSNDELVRRAFAAPDFEAEFKESKDDEIDAALAKGREKLPSNLDGWGSWAGDGAPVPQGPTKRQVLAKKVQAKKEEALKQARQDDRLPKVVLSEKRQKRSAKYMVSEVPYPFTSREQYERSLRQPIGGEWNTSQSVRAMTRPAVVVRAGVAVNPMKLGKLHRDNAKDGSAGGVVSAKGAKGGAGEGKARGGAGRRRGSKAGPKGS